jgi:hypothetical protein
MLIVRQLVKHFMEVEGLPLVLIVSQINPVHAVPLHLFETYFNIIFPFVPVSSKWPSSFWFLHQNHLHVCPLPCMCYMPCPSHPPWFDHQNNFWWWVQTMKLLMQFSLVSCYLIPLRLKPI